MTNDSPQDFLTPVCYISVPPKPRSYVAVREYPAYLSSRIIPAQQGRAVIPEYSTRVREEPAQGSFCWAEVRLHLQAANAHGEKRSGAVDECCPSSEGISLWADPACRLQPSTSAL